MWTAINRTIVTADHATKSNGGEDGMLCNILRKLANVPILFSSYPKCGDNGLIKLRTQLEYLACVDGTKPYDWMVDESNSTILTLCKGISSVLGQDSQPGGR